MTISLQDVAYGSTVQHLDVLVATLDLDREGDRQQLTDCRVLDVSVDRLAGPDHDSWFLVCVENLAGQRSWVQAPAQQLTIVLEPNQVNIGVLPPIPARGSSRVGDVRHGVLQSLRQVPPGTSIALTEAYEPVRPANFPAPAHMFTGKVKDIRPADPGYNAMLVYMASEAGEEGWLKVPTNQQIVILDLPETPGPDAPWHWTSPMPTPAPADESILSEVAPGTIVSGLAVYPLEAVTGISKTEPMLMDNALIRDINPLGVDVDGREMVILAVDDGKQESVLIAKAHSTVTTEYAIPEWAKPSPVRLVPMSDWAQNTPFLTPVFAQGTDPDGGQGSFYGTLYRIEHVDDGWVASIDEGTSDSFAADLLVPEEGLWRFEGQAGGEVLPVLPAAYLKPNHIIVNDDGARAVVIANEADQAGTRSIVVQMKGVGVNGGIVVPSGKLFAVENNLADLAPDDIDYEMSLAVEIHQMPPQFEETFAKIAGFEDPHAPGLG